MAYRIREIDTENDEDLAKLIHDLNRLHFPPSPLTTFDVEDGHWWLAKTEDGELAAWAGLVKSTHYPNSGYFKRVGVMEKHRGHSLQFRLMQCIESRAKRNGWTRIYSDTTDNRPSDNNFIRSDWRLFDPKSPWAFKNSLYWIKKLSSD